MRQWQSFWFHPQSMYPLGLVRMAFGVMMMCWSASLLPDLRDYFGPQGLRPQIVHGPYRLTIFALSSTDRTVLVCWVVLFVASIAMTVGWRSRLASVLVCVLVMSFQTRNPSVFNAGDAVIRAEALFLAISPSGTALSLDQRRRTGRFWTAQERAPWALRLIQIQLTIIYLGTVRTKINGETWPNGTAVSYALRLEDMVILPAPNWVTHNGLLMNVATWLVLALEFCIGVFVWNRRLRPWVLTAGVIMHTGIAISVAVGFFSPAMFVLYLAFLSAETVQWIPTSLLHLMRKAPKKAPPPSAESVSQHEVYRAARSQTGTPEAVPEGGTDVHEESDVDGQGTIALTVFPEVSTSRFRPPGNDRRR